MKAFRRINVNPTYTHSPEHLEREQRFAWWLVVTGLIRVFGWTALAVLFLCKVTFAQHLFSDLQFVSFISVWALVETAFGQVAASWAQLAAARAHDDAEKHA